MLGDDLDRIAVVAARDADEGEELAGVLAAEPLGGGRAYLCAYRLGERVRWLAFEDDGSRVTDRVRVREIASIVALCEVAEDSAGGGELDELLARLVALRLTENPLGIDEAEDAVRDLQRTLAELPRVASHAYLDRVGSATKRLEAALGGGGGSGFAEAMQASAAAVQSLIDDVAANYKTPLD